MVIWLQCSLQHRLSGMRTRWPDLRSGQRTSALENTQKLVTKTCFVAANLGSDFFFLLMRWLVNMLFYCSALFCLSNVLSREIERSALNKTAVAPNRSLLWRFTALYCATRERRGSNRAGPQRVCRLPDQLKPLLEALGMKAQMIFHECGNEIITVVVMLVAAQRQWLLCLGAGCLKQFRQ